MNNNNKIAIISYLKLVHCTFWNSGSSHLIFSDVTNHSQLKLQKVTLQTGQHAYWTNKIQKKREMVL